MIMMVETVIVVHQEVVQQVELKHVIFVNLISQHMILSAVILLGMSMVLTVLI